jgi:hypothetical protein
MKRSLLLVVATALLVAPAIAQTQSKNTPADAATLAATLDFLKTPVPENELQSFSSDLLSLVRKLHDLNSAHPEIQLSMIQTELKISTLTPEQLTMLANAFNRPALSKAVQSLRSLKPKSKASSRLANATPQLGSGAPIQQTQVSPADSLTPPDYGMCTPSPPPTFLGAFPIPSDPSTDYGLFVGITVASVVQTVLNYGCDTIFVILGEGTNVVLCVIAEIAGAILYALQETMQIADFCDVSVTSARSDAAYYNTVAIYDNLAADTAVLTDLIQGVSTQVTNLGTTVNGDFTTLNNNLNMVATEITSQLTTFQNVDVRLKIEENLNTNGPIGLFELPQAYGGYLELALSVVADVINKLSNAKQDVHDARHLLAQAEAEYAAGSYKMAYQEAGEAYAAAVRVSPSGRQMPR